MELQQSPASAASVDAALPTVAVTSVIRSTNQGQSHGGVYLLDLATGDRQQVLDWDDGAIDWSGRGGDRGLRGLAFWRGNVILAASDEIFVYTPEFEPVASFRNPYLRHCHEIDVDGDGLYLTSCGFDTVLRFDLHHGRFTDGWCVRAPAVRRFVHRVASRVGRAVGRRAAVRPALEHFDPSVAGGPHPEDTCHVNSVRAIGGRLFVGARGFDRLYEIAGSEIRPYAVVPTMTHNAQPFADGVLVNDTEHDRVLFTDRRGEIRRSFDVARYDPAALENGHLAEGQARQAFGRGLAVWQERYLIAGSSPATVAVHDLRDGDTVGSWSLTMDVRNAVHGLEVWPFGR